MRSFIIILLSFFHISVLACEDEHVISPFATEVLDYNGFDTSLKYFEILSPVQKGNVYLSSITARVKGKFEFSLDIREDRTYKGNFYISNLGIPEDLLDKVEIFIAYNTTRKDRKTVIFCGNFDYYKLSELLKFEKAKQAPPPPPKLPPNDLSNSL
ncbi:hypothetical protein JF50_11685 [Pseudoalteromonas luteoviolacea]|uniref:Uncharacterized protein n=1 Tax=Pseudoalteromonas luteoviolacea TaxID=43657 RepID=A0A0C1QB20_9GAMM|nr:hypothetical protein [Pseudoalteromonas luteoviolacea]KID56590.1 hypothetical protein JF50_11685 [Pseudoalteromonas luteoviolacea]